MAAQVPTIQRAVSARELGLNRDAGSVRYLRCR
jgi:hypothetical protein